MTQPSTSIHATRLGPFVSGIVALWFLVSLMFSLTGVFDSPNRPPLVIAAFAVIPIIAFWVAYLSWPQFRTFVLSANPALLTLAHTWRIAGITFLILYSRSQLPGVFALSAGWGDITIGITAPFLAWAMARGIAKRQLIILWNALGLFDLVVAITLGVLSSAGPLGILTHGVTTQLMGRFPLSLIPTFLVPLFIIFHLITLAMTKRARGNNA